MLMFCANVLFLNVFTFKESKFIEALKDGKEDKAIFLAQFMKNEINELYDYRSPLFWASRYGNEKVAQALREMGAVEEVDKEGMSDELIKILDAEDIDEIDEAIAKYKNTSETMVEIKYSLFICKKRAAVYTTTALKVPNFFVIFLPTIIHTLVNTPRGAFQQP